MFDVEYRGLKGWEIIAQFQNIHAAMRYFAECVEDDPDAAFRLTTPLEGKLYG